MSTFIGDLNITQLEDWELFRLGQDLTLDLGGGRIITAPSGFITDGPSIPRLFWNIVPVWGKWSRSGVIHDFLCCLLAMGRPHEVAPTRYDCDRIFASSMWDVGVGWFWMSVLFLGVCFGRWFKVRTTMIDHNIKLSAILDARIQISTTPQIQAAKREPGGGTTALPLIRDDHPHTYEALDADPNRIVRDPVARAKQQAEAKA